jgi:hypothetical protein
MKIKKITPIILIVVFLGLMVSSAQAQVSLGISGGVRTPFGTSAGSGFRVMAKYNLGDKALLGVNVSSSYFEKKFADATITVNSIMFSIEHQFGKVQPMRPYIGIDMGAYTIDERTKSSSFGLCPTVGFIFGGDKRISCLANGKMNLILSASEGALGWLGLNFGMLIKIVK